MRGVRLIGRQSVLDQSGGGGIVPVHQGGAVIAAEPVDHQEVGVAGPVVGGPGPLQAEPTRSGSAVAPRRGAVVHEPCVVHAFTEELQRHRFGQDLDPIVELPGPELEQEPHDVDGGRRRQCELLGFGVGHETAGAVVLAQLHDRVARHEHPGRILEVDLVDTDEVHLAIGETIRDPLWLRFRSRRGVVVVLLLQEHLRLDHSKHPRRLGVAVRAHDLVEFLDREVVGVALDQPAAETQMGFEIAGVDAEAVLQVLLVERGLQQDVADPFTRNDQGDPVDQQFHAFETVLHDQSALAGVVPHDHHPLPGGVQFDEAGDAEHGVLVEAFRDTVEPLHDHHVRILVLEVAGNLLRAVDEDDGAGGDRCGADPFRVRRLGLESGGEQHQQGGDHVPLSSALDERCMVVKMPVFRSRLPIRSRWSIEDCSTSFASRRRSSASWR